MLEGGEGLVRATCQVKFSLDKLVVAGKDGEVWMPDWSDFIAFPSKAGIFRGRLGGRYFSRFLKL